MLYHGYEAGFHTLGRQTLMVPLKYSADGWFDSAYEDESGPLPSPQGGQTVPHGLRLSDRFESAHLGPQWRFFRGGANELKRVEISQGTLHLKASGTSPANSSPLCLVSGDHAYDIEIDVSFDPGVQAGLLLFYSDRLYAGVGLNDRAMMLHRYGLDQRNIAKPIGMQRSAKIRMSNRWHVLTLHTSHDDGHTWHKFPIQMDVSGYHHNVAYGFMSLRPAIYASGQGQARFSQFKYRAIA